MTKDRDRFERRAYRRSPGRQYGYDYDPLGSNRGGMSQSGRSNDSQTGVSPNQAASELAQSRPDPRRTRQLIRQSIIANKSRSPSAPLHEHDLEKYEDEQPVPSANQTDIEEDMYDEDYAEPEDNSQYTPRYRPRNNRMPPSPFIERVEEGENEVDEWNEMDYVDPDAGYMDPLDQRLDPAQESPAPHYAAPPRHYSRNLRREEPPIYDDDIAEEETYAPAARRKSKKRGLSRRKLLIGLGLAAGGVAAYEAAPRIPQALHDVGTNIEHQLQDAYNKGLAAGANEVRKDFITTLDNLEGYSLDAAITAAKLTRLAYDAFVSPLVTLAATVTGDFLNVTLLALKNARGFLAKFNQDSDTLAALQTVLETWIKQVHEVPKEIQSITASDLDGAQSYLRGLQRKLDEEKAKLNGQSTPTPTPKRS